MEWLQSHIGNVGIQLASLMTMLGEEMLLIVILGFLYWSYDKELGKRVGNVIVTVNVFFPMLKNVALRRRPYFDHTKVECLKPVESSADIYDISAQGFSFPSGHSGNATALYGSLGRFQKKRIFTVLAFVLPFLVGISRFALGVHYPTDVLAGWVFGTLLLFGVPALEKVFPKKWQFHVLLSLIGVIGFFFCNTADYYTGYGIMVGFFLGVAFEEKRVHFESTRRIGAAVLRLLGGILIYLVLNTVLKLPFSKDFLDSASFLAYLVRTVRYTLILFVMIGLYPILFSKKFLK